MNPLPWYPMYAADLETDFRFIRMSLAAQAIYVRLLNRMWMEGKGCTLPIKPKTFQKLFGVRPHMWTKLWRELMPDDDPIFVETDGFIHSPRLKKEYEKQLSKSKKAQAAAKRRWGGNIQEKACERNANAMRTRCEHDANQSQSQNKNKSTPPTPHEGGDVYSQEFDKFWESYPRKQGGKAKTFEVWKRAKKKKTWPGIEAVMSGLERLKKSGQWEKEGGKFIPYPQTFLNGGRWDDEPDGNGISRQDEARRKLGLEVLFGKEGD